MKAASRFVIGLLLFAFVTVTWALAEEPQKEKKEEKAILEEITVTGAPYTNPVTPVDTRYGTRYNL
ncbi:MAG: hypothetical protein QM300_01725, partial [Pseudomonadota bacterium]|nr:hypothetical protein [Pseudomonadota bacterium]